MGGSWGPAGARARVIVRRDRQHSVGTIQLVNYARLAITRSL
jgi:hypothetical protein